MEFKERLLALLPGHKSSNEGQQDSEHKDEYGLSTLYDGSVTVPELLLAEPSNGDQKCLEPVDFVAVHGLGGGAHSTWRHPQTGNIWLQNQLPDIMRASRIMTFGYDADIYRNRSTLHMMDNAENLLFEVLRSRHSEKLRSRRIVFVGHSLGGILIKKALIMAREEEKYRNILHSTAGIMFMGTPHDGADLVKLASTIANIAISVTALNTNNLETLERDAVPLQEISRSFGFLSDLKIVTVIESDKTRIPYSNTHILIVPQSSARLNLGDRETVFSIIGADHRMICKSTGKEDKQYQSKIIPALISIATSSSVSTSKLQYIPYSQDQNFTGREDIITRLSNAFFSQHGHTRLALYGLGGIGKSGIIIEFAYRLLKSRPELNLYWVRGATAQSFEDSYRSIARTLRLSGYDDPKMNVINLVKNWITASTTPWILVLDSADKESLYVCNTEKVSNDTSGTNESGEKAALQLSTHIPQSTNGCVLITSRDKKTALQLVGSLPENVIKIEEMSPAESESLMRTRLSKGKYNHADISTFITLLGGIPLAMTQACAYIEANELITVSEYCQKFRESEAMGQRLLGQASHDLRRDPDLPNAVITTWQISFDYLKCRNSLTASLLSLFGVLDRQNIPRFLAYVLHDDRLEVDEALSRVIAFSLVKMESSKEYFELHELVQIVLYAWIKNSDWLEYWVRHAMLILHQIFPQDLDVNLESWALCNILLPHAQKIIRTSRSIPNIRDNMLLLTCNDVATGLGVRCRFVESETFLKEAIELAIEIWGHADVRTLVCWCRLAYNLKDQIRFHDARKVYQDVWQSLTHSAQHSFELDELRVQVSSSLAMILSFEGQSDEAEKMLEEACTAVVKLLGEDNEKTLNIMHNLAIVKHKCGKSLEAEALGSRLVKKMRDLLGSAHRLTLDTITNLSECLASQEKFIEAQELLQEVAIVGEKLLPPGHQDRLATVQHLAYLFRHQKNYSSAEKILRHAQNDGEAFSQSNRFLKTLRVDLSQVLNDQGQFQEAERISREVLDSQPPLSVSLDDDTCKAMQILSQILRQKGRKQEAGELQWQILEHYENGKRPGNERTSLEGKSALSFLNAMTSYDCENDSPSDFYDKVLRLQDSVHTRSSKIFQTRVRILSNVLAESGGYTQAIKLRVRWREVSDNSSLWLVNRLAEVYVRIGKNDEAKTLLKPLIEEAQVVFGQEDKLTLSSIGFLANAIGLDTDEGAGLLKTIIKHSKDHPKLTITSWHNLGVSYQARAMKSEALQACTQANKLAMMRLEKGDTITMQTTESLEKLEKSQGLERLTSMIISSYDASIH